MKRERLLSPTLILLTLLGACSARRSAPQSTSATRLPTPTPKVQIALPPAPPPLPSPESARTCEDVEKINLALAAQCPEMVDGNSKTPLKSGPKHGAAWLGQLHLDAQAHPCVPTMGGFVALLLASCKGEDEDWNASLDAWAYLPAGADKAGPLAAKPHRLNAVGCDISYEVLDHDNQCSIFTVPDVTGMPAVIVTHRFETVGGDMDCSTPVDSHSRIYSIDKGAVGAYTRQFDRPGEEMAPHSIEDFDGDGVFDVWSQLDYRIEEENCFSQKGKRQTPAFLIHKRKDGTVSIDDAVARAAARIWCPVPPKGSLQKVDGEELVRRVLCARLWGQSAQKVRADLVQRCRHASHDSAPDPCEKLEPSEAEACEISHNCDHAFECHQGTHTCDYWLFKLVDAAPPFKLP